MNDPEDRRRAARAIAWVLGAFAIALTIAGAIAGGLLAGCAWQALVDAARL